MPDFSVHRFRKAVALNTPGGTFYLSPKDAAALGRALQTYAADCRQRPFTASVLPGAGPFPCADNYAYVEHKESSK